jgi:hypothetical protein
MDLKDGSVLLRLLVVGTIALFITCYLLGSQDGG